MLIFVAILFVIACVVAIYTIVTLNGEYKKLLCDYEFLASDLEGKRKALFLRDKEIECLKKELAILQEEKEVAKAENVKTVEELPKKEKVTKPRAKKTTKTTKK